ncbi:MAG: hypothetical protein AAF597_17345 [Bacteroidota bacterium]
MNEFEKRYAKLDDLQLLKVLKDSEKYHPEAIIAVKKELDSREISTVELEVVNEHFARKKSAQDEREAKKQRINRSATEAIKEFVDAINPIKTLPTGRRRPSTCCSSALASLLLTTCFFNSIISVSLAHYPFTSGILPMY